MKWKILMLSIMALLVINSCFAASIELSPNVINIQKGNNFTVDVLLRDIPEIAGYDSKLNYDKTILKLNSISLSTDVNSASLKDTNLNNDGSVSLLWMGNSVTGNLTVATFTFEAINEGDTKISLKNAALSDIEGQGINNFDTLDSEVLVFEPKPDLSIQNVTVVKSNAYEKNNISIIIKNIGQLDAVGFNVSLEISGIFESKYIKTVELLPNNSDAELIFEDVLLGPNNQISVHIDPENNIIEHKKENNQITFNEKPLERHISMILNSNIHPVNTGETFEVTVSLNNLTKNRPAKAVDGILKFDSNVLECLNFTFELVPSEAEGSYLENITISKKDVKFSIVDGEIKGDTVIAKATFKALTVGNSNISLESIVVSDVEGYEFNKMDVKYNYIMYKFLNDSKNIVIEESLFNKINKTKEISNNGSDINMTEIFFGNDSLVIPIVNSHVHKINQELFEKIEDILNNANDLKKTKINNESEMSSRLNKTLEGSQEILNSGFNVSNMGYDIKKDGNILKSRLTFNAVNTTNKSVLIMRFPIGNLNLDEIIVDTGTENVTLLENEFSSTVGWYRIPSEGVLEITLVKDPLVTIKLSSVLPSTDSPSSTNRRRSSSQSVTTIDQTEISKNVISSIKSEKIKQILSNAKVVAGNTVDHNYAANLRTDSIITTVSELNQDTVIVGGPLANPYAKMYDNKFDLKITNDYPGENKGVIQVKEINGYMVIYIAGSDRFGTLAALEYFKTLDELPEKPLIIEWTSTGSKLIK
ncbi:cohesin domain-containing protein [Methanococcus vannielii]|nr:cohesin domain-containing protein [Methanococcus vannielii]